MSWFIDQTVNAILQLVIAVVVFMTNKLCQPLGFSPEVIIAYFPGINTFTQSFKILSLFILILVVLFQLTKNIFNSFTYSEKDNPIVLMLRSALAIVLIMWSLSFMSYLYSAITQPFYILKDDNNEHLAFDVVNDEENVFRRSLNEAFTYFIESAESINEDEYDSVLDRISDWLFPGKAIITGIIELIAIALIGYKLIFFLIEILERYLILMIQTFTSPLIWSTIASQSTIGIFKKWSELLVSNVLLMYLDMWMLGIIIKAMSTVFNPETKILGIVNWQPNFILGIFLVYGMIRIAQSLDTYLGHILNTISMGRGLMYEVFMTLHSLQDTIRMIVRPTAQVASGVFEAASAIDSTPASQKDTEDFFMEKFEDQENDLIPEKFDPPSSDQADSNMFEDLLIFQKSDDSSDTDISEKFLVKNDKDLENELGENDFWADSANTSNATLTLDNINDDQYGLGNSEFEILRLNEAVEDNMPGNDERNGEKYGLNQMRLTLPYQEFLEKTGIDQNQLNDLIGEEYYLSPNEVKFDENGNVQIFGQNDFTGESGVIGTLRALEDTETADENQISGRYRTYAFSLENKTEDFTLDKNELSPSVQPETLNTMDNLIHKESIPRKSLFGNKVGILDSFSSPAFTKESGSKKAHRVSEPKDRQQEFLQNSINEKDSFTITETESITIKEFLEGLEGQKQIIRELFSEDEVEDPVNSLRSEMEYFE